MSNCRIVPTPTLSQPVHADKDGDLFIEDWNYAAIIGMLMYLASNTRPDIAYAVHQCARYTHNPRNSHAVAIKRILRYLKGTKDKGLIMVPTKTWKLDCHVDADFAGNFKSEDPNEPVSAKSRTGYVILFGGVPILWVSKLQTQIALSTMEAEYIALAQSMRDIIPLTEILKEIQSIVFQNGPTFSGCTTHCKAFKDVEDGEIPPKLVDLPKVTIYEDNAACIQFAKMPKLTPRT